MFISRTKKIVVTGLMLALGIVLPLITAHGYGIKGTILLPMHIPVFLCGFCCGPLYGCFCGFILPILNSMVTGMPTLFPSAIVMTFELGTYGLVSGLLYRKSRSQKRYLYPCLFVAMIAGRIMYGLIGSLLMIFHPELGEISVITALIAGIPGIIIQLILIPYIVVCLHKILKPEQDAIELATDLVRSGAKTCVVVRNNIITSSESPRGIKHIIELHDKGVLKDAFIADNIIGKSAAMIYTLSGVKRCYGNIVSESALKWLKERNVAVHYKKLVPVIQNRKGDGMCPMENTVLYCENEQEALFLLKNKISQHFC